MSRTKRVLRLLACLFAIPFMLNSCGSSAQQDPSAGMGQDEAPLEQINQRMHTLLVETQSGMGVSHQNIPAMQAAKTIGEQQRIFERSVASMDRIKPALDSIGLYALRSRSIVAQHPADLSARVLDSIDIVLSSIAHSYRSYADEYDSLWYYLCKVDTALPAETTRMPWEFQRHAAIKDSLEASALRNKARLQYLTNRWTALKAPRSK